jgi:sulfate adenylyltransferase subunit 1
MDILRIATAGSVDDGKSTLIGRLLYETNSITKDKIEALETASKRKGLDFLDLSLLTDGLIAEREQGITIDVAHIYLAHLIVNTLLPIHLATLNTLETWLQVHQIHQFLLF